MQWQLELIRDEDVRTSIAGILYHFPSIKQRLTERLPVELFTVPLQVAFETLQFPNLQHVCRTHHAQS